MPAQTARAALGGTSVTARASSRLLLRTGLPCDGSGNRPPDFRYAPARPAEGKLGTTTPDLGSHRPCDSRIRAMGRK